MQSLTDEEIMTMSPSDAELYTTIHPEEAHRIARLFLGSAARQAIKSAKHRFISSEEALKDVIPPDWTA